MPSAVETNQRQSGKPATVVQLACVAGIIALAVINSTIATNPVPWWPSGMLGAIALGTAPDSLWKALAAAVVAGSKPGQ